MDNDVIRPVAPSTGAEEMVLAANQAEYNEVVVAKYLSQAVNEDGIADETARPIPTILYRFRPSDRQRAQIVAGEDLFLAVLTFGRPPLPLHLQVGPGSFQLTRRIVSPHDDMPPDPSTGRIILP